MKNRQSRSLLRRLLLGFMGVMFIVWLFLLAISAYEAKKLAKEFESGQLKAAAGQVLVMMQAIPDQPDAMRRIAMQIEQLQNASYEEMDMDHAFHIQVWKGTAAVYASSDLPVAAPSIDNGSAGTLPLDSPWVAWAETDRASGITVRVAQKSMGGWQVSTSSFSYYFLPLLFSFPFLLLPAWLTIRYGFRPLKFIIAEIGGRSASDLSPLAASPYKELLPLVSSVNLLMKRLKEGLEREQEFLIDAAHELKTPLAVIQVNADALIKTRDPQRLQEAGEGLQKGVARATHAVHQLLALARSDIDREPAGLQPADLVELVRDRVALAAPLALRRSIDIELQAPEQCMLPLHRESMVSLIDNLIDNAVKYSPGHGRILVVVKAQAQRVQLTIADEGPGISVAMHAKVFERFFRLPGQDQAGSGLGLAIAERAAARNNGLIRLDAGLGGAGLTAAVDFSV